VDQVLELGEKDTLRLMFTASDGDQASRPHQSFVLVEDPTQNLQISIPVSTKPSGKAKLDIVALSTRAD
jgi:dolichyl-diphosphooligosaccharide---protein glycosyltransferase subunit 2 (ribophorin II)